MNDKNPYKLTRGSVPASDILVVRAFYGYWRLTPARAGVRPPRGVVSVQVLLARASAPYAARAGHGELNTWKAERKAIEEDIKTAQFGWPLGMPLIRKLGGGLWEVRSHLDAGIARAIFTVEGSHIVLLHDLGKNSQRTPPGEMKTAQQRLADVYEE